MGTPRQYESNAERQKAYRRRRAVKGKSVEQLAYRTLEELHKEVRADAASGDNDRARFAAVALGRSPLETVIKLMYYAEICDPTYDDFADFHDGDHTMEMLQDKDRRDYFRTIASISVRQYLNLSQDNIELKLKWWGDRPEE
jgi:hypothetical protein